MGDVVRARHLPAKPEDLARYVIVAGGILSARRAELKVIQRIHGAHEVYRRKLYEAQQLAELTLTAQQRLGSYLSDADLSVGGRPRKTPSHREGVSTLRQMGITHKLSWECQALSSHPQIVEQVIAQARQRGDVASKREVMRLVRASEVWNEVDTPPLPQGKYSVIYADPPWLFQAGFSGRSTQQHYPVMSLDRIVALGTGVRRIAADDAVLLLWTTAPHLADALRVVEAWGFEYKTNAVWDKEVVATGYWWRVRHEQLLLATRGSPKPPKPSLRCASVLSQRKTEHSRKPDVYFTMIERWFPHTARIELFARRYRPGWTVWGHGLR